MERHPKHPMQPIVWDERPGQNEQGAVLRFKANGIIRWLCDTGKLNLNEIAVEAANGRFQREDQVQLAQLLGYSICGFWDLPYVKDKDFDAAEKAAEEYSVAFPVASLKRSEDGGLGS